MKDMDWKRLQIPYEFTMAVLAFINLYFFYFAVTGSLNPSEMRVATVIDYVTIGVFAMDYVVRLVLSKNKIDYISHNVIELISLIPLSPVFQGARLFRCFFLFGRFYKRLKNFSSLNIFLYVAFGTIVVLFTAALLIAPLEHMTFWEGIWWGVVTIATVGYGDFIPVTVPGRIIAMVLMFCGIGLLSFMTGTITTHYVNKRMERVGVDSHREILRHYQKQLLHFSEMSEEDIDDMHTVLKGLKAKDMEKEKENLLHKK